MSGSKEERISWIPRKRKKALRGKNILQILAISVSWRSILHMDYSRKTQPTEDWPCSQVHIHIVRSSVPSQSPSFFPLPTVHPPRKPLSKYNLCPSPRSPNRTKTKVSASHGPRRKRIWMPSRLSLRRWKLSCEKRELHSLDLALGWRRI